MSIKNYPKTHIFRFVAFCIVAFAILIYSLKLKGYGSGASIAGYTNAPSESNCTSCHSGTLQSNPAAMIHNTSFIGSGYFPDSTYSMTLAFKNSGTSKFGFSITCLDEATNSPIGTLATIGTKVQSSTATFSSKLRTYITHTSSGTATTSTDSIYWTFSWKAPATIAGNVIFYAVVNATNGNNATNGDVVYAKTFKYGLSTSLSKAKATSNDTMTCVGKTITVSGSATNTPLSYEWAMAGASKSTDTAKNTSFSYSTSGTKIVRFRAKNQYGFGDWDTLRIVVNNLPLASISGATTRKICEGDSVLLSSSFQANTTYLWNPINKTGNAIWVKDSGNYTVTATNTSTLCTATSSAVNVKVIKKVLPQLINKTAKDTVCNLFPIHFGITPLTGFDSFNVYINNILFTTLPRSDSFIIIPPIGDSFSIKINTISDGCVSVFSNQIKKYTLPSPSSPLPNCNAVLLDSAIIISWRPLANILNYEISDDTGKSWNTVSKFDSSYTFTGLVKRTTKRFLIRSVSTTACPKSNSAAIVCGTNSCITPYDKIIIADSICAHINTGMVFRNLATNNFDLFINNQKQTFNDSIVTINITRDSQLRISLQDKTQASCANFTDSIVIKSLNNTAFNATQLNADSVCKNSEVAFNILPNVSSANYTLNELVNGTPIFITNNKINDKLITLVQKDIAFYRILVAEKTCSTAFDFTHFGKNNPVFTINVGNNWLNYSLLAKPSIHDYIWTDSAQFFAPQNTDSAVFFMAGKMNSRQKFYVNVQSINGCSTKDSIAFNVFDHTNILNLSETELIFYPNPVIDHLSFNLLKIPLKNIQIIDAIGKIAVTFSPKIGNNNIDCSSLTKGQYFLIDENGLYLGKFIKE